MTSIYMILLSKIEFRQFHSLSDLSFVWLFVILRYITVDSEPQDAVKYELLIHSVIVNTCDDPSVENGCTDPASGTVDYGETYSITCDTAYKASNTTTAEC